MFKSRKSITNGLSHSPHFVNTNLFVMPLQSSNTFGTIKTTNAYNEQFERIFTSLNEKRQELQSRVSSLPPGDDSLRNQGVYMAWKYEQAEIQMGVKGLEIGQMHKCRRFSIGDECEEQRVII